MGIIIGKPKGRGSIQGCQSGADSLPEDVTLQILMKLPTKSLMRFKSVSKDWYSLITADSYFISSHLQYHLRNSTQLSLILVNPTRIRSNYDSKILLLQDESDITDLDISYLTNGDCRKYVRDMMVCCTGLVCLSFSDDCADIILWNPATREFKHLPKAPPFAAPSKPYLQKVLRIYYSISLGFDSENNDYKLVRMARNFSRNSGDEQVLFAQVLSLKSNSWRDLKPPLRNLFWCSSRVDIDGVLYGTALPREVVKSILSLDLRSLEFQKIHPPGNNSDSLCELVKWNKGNSLGAIIRKNPPGVFELWLMGSDVSIGPKRSWTKMYTIGPFHHDRFWYGAWNDRFLVTKSFGKQERLLSYDMVTGKELLLYDVATEEERMVVEEDRRPFLYFARFYAYTESLVSVNIQPN